MGIIERIVTIKGKILEHIGIGKGVVVEEEPNPKVLEETPDMMLPCEIKNRGVRCHGD